MNVSGDEGLISHSFSCRMLSRFSPLFEPLRWSSTLRARVHQHYQCWAGIETDLVNLAIIPLHHLQPDFSMIYQL